MVVVRTMSKMELTGGHHRERKVAFKVMSNGYS